MRTPLLSRLLACGEPVGGGGFGAHPAATGRLRAWSFGGEAMRILAGGGAGALVAIVGVLAWGAANGGRGGAVAWLICLGGVVVPAGFAAGCVVGAVVTAARGLIRLGHELDYWK